MSRRQQDADDDRRVAYVDLMKRSGVAWVDDRAPTPGAALAFYSSFIGAAADHRYRGCRRSVRRQCRARQSSARSRDWWAQRAAEAIQALLKAAPAAHEPLPKSKMKNGAPPWHPVRVAARRTCLFQFGLMSIELGLANGSVVARLELLPHAMNLGIGSCFSGAQLAVAIGVESRKRISGS
jgi:hypothetical protein